MPQQLQTRELQQREHGLFIRNGSVNAEARTFEAVVASERQATVFDYRSFEPIDEVLLSDGGSFPESIPILDSHDRSQGVGELLGTAGAFVRDGEQWTGVGRIATPVEGNTRLAQVWQNVRDGIITDVSIGYEVGNYVDIPAGKRAVVGETEYQAGERTLRVTTDWRVHELSLTAIGADQNAKIRGMSKGEQRPQKRSYFAR